MSGTSHPAQPSFAFRGRSTPRKPKNDRRQSNRFPITLPAQYRVPQHEPGWGLIRNIGSGGALVSISEDLKVGDLIELCISWPVMLDAKVPLNLVAEGSIVRTEEGQAAVRFERSSFRTASSSFQVQARNRAFSAE